MITINVESIAIDVLISLPRFKKYSSIQSDELIETQNDNRNTAKKLNSLSFSCSPLTITYPANKMHTDETTSRMKKRTEKIDRLMIE